VGFSWTHIRVSINGVQKLFIRDATLQNGMGAGLLGYAGTSGNEQTGLVARFDNFSATQGLCGNGIVDRGEECDDGENNNGRANFCNTTCGNYTRLASDWPFASSSPFNRPIGSDADYVDDANISKGSAWTANTVNWSRSLVISMAFRSDMESGMLALPYPTPLLPFRTSSTSATRRRDRYPVLLPP
jgi:hypothetical protein